MKKNITVIQGDGIGPEVVKSATTVLHELVPSLQFEMMPMGLMAVKEFNCALPQITIDSIKKNKVALKGPTTTPVGGGHQSANVLLRKQLDLFACIRPVKSMRNFKTKFENVDLIIVRENTEGLYTGNEFLVDPNIAISLRTISKEKTQRVANEAFLLASKLGRKKVTIAHKANILKLADGLFLNTIKDVAKDFPNIEVDDCIIDALAMSLVMCPEKFDVIILENMFGDIISDLGAGLIGGLGVAPGANIGYDGAVFEAVHGSAPDIAGQNKANPLGMLKSAKLMLDHLQFYEQSLLLEKAIDLVFEQKELLTADLGGKNSCAGFAEEIVKKIRYLAK